MIGARTALSDERNCHAQSMRFSAAGLGLAAGLISVLVFRDGQAEQPTAKTAGFAVSVAEQPVGQKPVVQNSVAPSSAVANSASAARELNLSSLTIQSGGRNANGGDASSFTLAGRDSRQQLIVTGALAASGQLRDLTRQVRYSAEPDGIAPDRRRWTGVAAVGRKGDDNGAIAERPKVVDRSDRRGFCQRSAGEFSQSNRPGFHEARMQRGRVPREGKRPEWFPAVAIGFRAQRGLRASRERRARPPVVARRAR